MHVFKHPKYYTELRKRNRVARNPMGGYSQSDQAISNAEATAASERAPGQGHKQRDSQVVNQVKLSSQSQASSSKPQASSVKPQAPEASSDKHQVLKRKLQASSHKLQAPRF